MAGSRVAGHGERRRVGRLLGVIGDHDVITPRRRAGQVELGEQGRAPLECHLRRGDRRAAAVRNQADRRGRRELGTLDRERGRARVARLGRSDARDLERQRLSPMRVNGWPLPEPVSPWTRMSYVPAWVSGITTCWVVWVGEVEDARFVLDDRHALVADVKFASLERGEPGRDRDVLPGRYGELIIEALAVLDRARDRAAQGERGQGDLHGIRRRQFGIGRGSARARGRGCRRGRSSSNRPARGPAPPR